MVVLRRKMLIEGNKASIALALRALVLFRTVEMGGMDRSVGYRPIPFDQDQAVNSVCGVHLSVGQRMNQ